MFIAPCAAPHSLQVALTWSPLSIASLQSPIHGISASLCLVRQLRYVPPGAHDKRDVKHRLEEHLDFFLGALDTLALTRLGAALIAALACSRPTNKLLKSMK